MKTYDTIIPSFEHDDFGMPDEASFQDIEADHDLDQVPEQLSMNNMDQPPEIPNEGAESLNIVKFDHKYAAGKDVMDHARVAKFMLKPQPRPQDILYIKKTMRKTISEKRKYSFKNLVGDGIIGLSHKSKSRLNIGSCLLVLLTLANRQSLSLERKEDAVFGDFAVQTETPGKTPGGTPDSSIPNTPGKFLAK